MKKILHGRNGSNIQSKIVEIEEEWAKLIFLAHIYTTSDFLGLVSHFDEKWQGLTAYDNF